MGEGKRRGDGVDVRAGGIGLGLLLVLEVSDGATGQQHEQEESMNKFKGKGESVYNYILLSVIISVLVVG